MPVLLYYTDGPIQSWGAAQWHRHHPSVKTRRLRHGEVNSSPEGTEQVNDEATMQTQQSGCHQASERDCGYLDTSW